MWRGEGLQPELQTPGLALDPPAGALVMTEDPIKVLDLCLFHQERGKKKTDGEKVPQNLSDVPGSLNLGTC